MKAFQAVLVLACVGLLSCNDGEASTGLYRPPLTTVVGGGGSAGAQEGGGGTGAVMGSPGMYSPVPSRCTHCSEVDKGLASPNILCKDNGPPSSVAIYDDYYLTCECAKCPTECEVWCTGGKLAGLDCRLCRQQKCGTEWAACKADLPPQPDAGADAEVDSADASSDASSDSGVLDSAADTSGN